ncbi:tetratricopeptide repeat protein [Brucepastera parasyntrophica]|uniref:tetratricopeptide repeat protein n=1 Tax=Brucepastera parasyntrophica TaxID=2880008 RepID=UPI00210DAED0|nr:tetratricopeptide repeat protein [Brucepastera parasyntrophica]ULQ60557.1 tetratricopeptide repeat protein [Brucepastera parasyntrophica]
MYANHRSRLTFFICVFFVQFSLYIFSQTPRDVFEQSRRTQTIPEAITLLEKNLPNAGIFTPYYLLELARLSSENGDWKASLEWSKKQDLAALPVDLADQVYYLYGQALEQTGQKSAAAELYKKRIETKPAAIPLLYLSYFRIGSSDAEKLSGQLDRIWPDLKRQDPEEFALSRYLAGICAVRAGEWGFAARSFALFSPEYDKKFPDYAPWSWYYRAWSLYRQGNWKEASSVFKTYLDTWPNHAGSWQAATAATLASIQAGTDALPFAARAVRLAPTMDDLAESMLLQASILIDRKDFQQASGILEGIADGTATSGRTPSAARAQYMLGDIAFRQNNPGLAEQRWLALSEQFPKDPLAEEAWFRSAEGWYIYGNWQKAADLFSSYRQTWPSGRFIDSVLRSGGDAWNRAGNQALAILWWEELLKKFPDSPVVPRAYNDLVDAYRSSRDYTAALNTAETYLSRFPEEARLDGIPEEIDFLQGLINGNSPDTTALLAAYNKAGKASSAEGRAAGLTLARQYLTDFSKRNDARTILRDITAKAPKTPASLSREEISVYAASWLLLGNIYREDANFRSAASALLSAGTYYAPIDGDRSAEALYGAADSFIQAGLRADAAKTVETLKSTWPDSVWTRKAALLAL